MTPGNASLPRLSWPPPGLERVPGRLPTLVALLALGDLLLVLPLIASLATEQDFVSFGAFGASWWVPIASTVVGVIILAAGFESLVRLLWSAAKATQAGHGWRLVLHVIADVDRDSGFLIQGIRHYEGVSPSQRKLILEMKLVGVLAYGGAVVWAPFGFSLSIMLAALGWVGTGTMWVLAVVLPALAAVVGVTARLGSRLLARSVRKGGAGDPRHLSGEVAAWSETLAGAATAEGFDTGRPRRLGYRVLAIGMILVGVVAIIPPIILTVSGGIAPLLSSIVMPSGGMTLAKLAAAEVFRPYAAPTDSTVTPQAAGEALQVISMIGVGKPGPVMQVPVRSYDPAWNDSTSVRILGRPHAGSALDLLRRASDGFTREEQDALRRIAQHPIQSEFTTIAGAGSVDVVGTRWTIPFPEDMPRWGLPLARFTPLKRAAAEHFALAAFELSEGRAASAERAIREVISVGFVLIDDAPLLIDNLVGTTLVRSGGSALLALYRETGRSADADRMEQLLNAVVSAVDRVRIVSSGPTSHQTLRTFARLVTDTAAPPGIRWEGLGLVSAFGGCLNLHSLVFGTGREYAEWRERAHAGLVRMPSEEELFRLFSRGLFEREGCGTLVDQLRLLRMVY